MTSRLLIGSVCLGGALRQGGVSGTERISDRASDIQHANGAVSNLTPININVRNAVRSMER